jgi:hypothetical protein
LRRIDKFRARRLFLEQQFRRDARHDLVHFGHRGTRGVGGTHQRAHAGAGDAVHRHAVLLEHLEYADVGRAARAATGQHQADFRALGRRRRRDGFGCAARQGQCGQQQ